MSKKKIIFIHPGYTTFVKKDHKFLKQYAEVPVFYFAPEKGLLKFMWQYIRHVFFMMKHIWSADAIFCWFAGFHSFLPALLSKIFQKKMIIIVGGYDAVSVPEMKYGMFYKKDARQWFAIRSFNWASLILPVHKSLIEGMNLYADPNGLPTGVKAYLPQIKTSFEELPTGYDSEIWKMKTNQKKTRSVITVANINNYRTYIGKGIDLLLEIAHRIPDAEFKIIGVSDEMKAYIEERKTENVILYGFIDNEVLMDYIGTAKVYAQLSLSEGLPNALCEAMLCECIPVGSNVNGIPDGIGEAGYLLNQRNAEEATKLVIQALEADENLGKKARAHIINKFPNERREKALLEILSLN